MNIDFSGKNVLITGGTGGIGRYVVEGIVDGGGHVYLTYNSRPAVAEAMVSEYGTEAITPVQIDMSDPAKIRAAYADIIEKAGRIDVLINVAGIISKVPFQELSQEEWDKTISVNLTAVFAGCHALYPHMCEQGGGRIVNVSSVAGKIGGGLLGTAAYAASKASVNALTKAIAKEGGAKGVYCNSVCPGFTETPMTRGMEAEKEQRIVASTSLKRAAQPREIANVVLFYASDLASYCNGEVTDVDGGLVYDG